MGCGVGPVRAPAGGLGSTSQGFAQHHRVGADGNRPRDVTAGLHPTIGDDLDVTTRLLQMTTACPGGIGDGSRLADPQSQYLPGHACVAGAHADKDAGRSGSHEV